MRSMCIAAGALSFAPCAGADSLSSAHFPNPDARFSDALGARDLAIEALLNASPDGTEANAPRKRFVPEKAGGTVFGSIRNSFGTPLCGLVLANGQFMFSCSPVGAYSIDTVTDAQGAVTLFGFVDGHFPYKKALNGFGRWDIDRLQVLRRDQQPRVAVRVLALRGQRVQRGVFA